MSKSLITRATEATTEAIKSSKDHFGKLQTATILNVLLMTEGRPEQFNRLFNEVTYGDRESIRTFLTNLTKRYGWTETNASGNDVAKGPFKVSKVGNLASWGLIEGKEENRKASCKAIVEAGEDTLKEISFENASNASNREFQPYNFKAAIAKAILKAAKEGGSIGEINAVNRALGDVVPTAEIEAARNAMTDALAKSRANTARLEKIVSNAVKAELKPEQTKKAA